MKKNILFICFLHSFLLLTAQNKSLQTKTTSEHGVTTTYTYYTDNEQREIVNGKYAQSENVNIAGKKISAKKSGAVQDGYMSGTWLYNESKLYNTNYVYREAGKVYDLYNKMTMSATINYKRPEKAEAYLGGVVPGKLCGALIYNHKLSEERRTRFGAFVSSKETLDESLKMTFGEDGITAVNGFTIKYTGLNLKHYQTDKSGFILSSDFTGKVGSTNVIYLFDNKVLIKEIWESSPGNRTDRYILSEEDRRIYKKYIESKDLNILKENNLTLLEDQVVLSMGLNFPPYSLYEPKAVFKYYKLARLVSYTEHPKWENPEQKGSWQSKIDACKHFLEYYSNEIIADGIEKIEGMIRNFEIKRDSELENKEYRLKYTSLLSNIPKLTETTALEQDIETRQAIYKNQYTYWGAIHSTSRSGRLQLYNTFKIAKNLYFSDKYNINDFSNEGYSDAGYKDSYLKLEEAVSFIKTYRNNTDSLQQTLILIANILSNSIKIEDDYLSVARSQAEHYGYSPNDKVSVSKGKIYNPYTDCLYYLFDKLQGTSTFQDYFNALSDLNNLCSFVVKLRKLKSKELEKELESANSDEDKLALFQKYSTILN